MADRKRPRPAHAQSLSWYAGKRPVLLFGIKFVGIVVAFQWLSMAPIFHRASVVYLEAVAGSAHVLLQALGEGIQRTGETIWSTKYSVTVRQQCSALELAWFLGAAMLAFPASWKRRTVGITAGVAALAVLNAVRVASLYLVGAHAPAYFTPMHENVWPGLLVLATLGIMVLWIGPPASEGTLADETVR